MFGKSLKRVGQLARFIQGSNSMEICPFTGVTAPVQGMRDGRSKRISLNTPADALAQVTYRSINAVSLMPLQRHQPDVVPRRLVDHFADLAARGWLLPFVNEELRIQDRTRPLEATVRRYCSRSTSAWELQSQVAAMRSMARTP